MRSSRTVLVLVLTTLFLVAATGIMFAQTEPPPPGAPGLPGPQGPAGSTIFGLDQTTAIVIGVVLVLVIILAMVAVSRGGGSTTVKTD